MGKPGTLSELISATYDDPELQEWVSAKVAEAGTEPLIMRGERVLPHPIDALRNMDREKGIRDLPTDPGAKDALIMDLSRRMAAMEQANQQKAGA